MFKILISGIPRLIKQIRRVFYCSSTMPQQCISCFLKIPAQLTTLTQAKRYETIQKATTIHDVVKVAGDRNIDNKCLFRQTFTIHKETWGAIIFTGYAFWIIQRSTNREKKRQYITTRTYKLSSVLILQMKLSIRFRYLGAHTSQQYIWSNTSRCRAVCLFLDFFSDSPRNF